MMHRHTYCICLTSSTVRLKCFFKLPSICMATRVQFVWFSIASSNCLPEQMQIRSHCICLLFTTMCFEIALIFPVLHVTTATLDSFVQVTWNITWRGSRQKRKYSSVCLFPVQFERGSHVGLYFNSNSKNNPVIIFSQDFLLKLLLSYGLSPDIDLCWDFKWCQMKHTTQRRKVVQLDRIGFDIDYLKIDVQ